MSIWGVIWKTTLTVAIIAGIIYAYKRNQKFHLAKEAEIWKSREAHESTLIAKMNGHSDRIRRFAGTGNCLKDDDCAVVGLGAKVCGKYQSFFHYSLRTVEQDPFDNAVHEFNDIQEEIARDSLSMKKCGTDRPQTGCVNHRCGPKS